LENGIHRAVRDVCLWLPEAEEFLSHGSPNFRVRGKTFATYVVNHHGDGRVALELKRVWHDGTRELVFEPLEFLERLAAMTPRPETNLLICHGVLAPRARWRERVVAYGRVLPEPRAAAAPLAAGPDDARVKPTPRAWTWAALMHRAFAIDVLACPHCGGRLRLIATLHDPAVIRKILAHVGVDPSGPSPGPAPPKSGAATPLIGTARGRGGRRRACAVRRPRR